jgi:hypothetical protein
MTLPSPDGVSKPPPLFVYLFHYNANMGIELETAKKCLSSPLAILFRTGRYHQLRKQQMEYGLNTVKGQNFTLSGFLKTRNPLLL